MSSDGWILRNTFQALQLVSSAPYLKGPLICYTHVIYSIKPDYLRVGRFLTCQFPILYTYIG